MKRFLIACLALATVPLFAETAAKPSRRPAMKYSSTVEVRPFEGGPGSLKRLVAQYEASRLGKTQPQSGRRLAPQAVGDARSSRSFVFPAAGNVRGAGGEFFRSDVTLVSFDDVDQDVAVLWLQNGANTDNPPARTITLEPNTYYIIEDFVNEVFDITQQLGGIVVLPVVGNEFDEDSALDGFSRIWTEQPSNPIGTVSQPFPAVDLFDFYVFETASLLGLRNDAQYRTNFGIVNADDHALTFTIRFMGERASNTVTLTVPPLGMIQQPVPAGDYGNLAIEIDVSDPLAFWIPYASSTDNRTGDGWVAIGGAVFTPEDLDDIGV